ncbi:hypothetical protein O6H91_18G004900 [Diphasiastrum complanatum]|uniref:Uncharacterized protein n=1 Tax=Diphasiastrum complanatum TaxID=34168 RepID=A0ACC2AXV4_DIPCM|nr:hypothetical protein O6H91_18G004900 [Diphasiastrum complanatum]
MYGRQNSDPRPSLYPPIYGEALPPPQTMVPDPYDPYRIFPAPVADEPFAYGRHPSSGTRHPHSTVPPGLDEPGYGVPYPPPHSEYEWHSPHHHGHHESFNAQDEYPHHYGHHESFNAQHEYPPAPAYGHFSSQRVDHPYERDSHEESHAHERHHSHDRSHDSPDHSHHHPSHFRPTSPHSAHYREEEFGPEFSEHSRPSVSGPVVKVFCKANTDYSLALRHDGVVLIPASKDDESQQWILDQSWGSRVRDGTGQPAFALINKASNRALKHAKEAAQQVFTCSIFQEQNRNGLVLNQIALEIEVYKE